LLLGREPPTESENGPRAATSLVAEVVKKTVGVVSAVVPGMSVASCTKSRPFNGAEKPAGSLMTWPREGFEVSTALRSIRLQPWNSRWRGQSEIQFALLIHVQFYILALHPLEALEFHPDRIDGYRQQVDDVVARIIGLGFATCASALEVTLTEAPEIAEPDLSVTVPRKLPVAWPYAICPQQAATIQTTTAVRILLHILLTSLRNPAKLIIRIQSLKNKRSALHPQCQEPRRP